MTYIVNVKNQLSDLGDNAICYRKVLTLERLKVRSKLLRAETDEFTNFCCLGERNEICFSDLRNELLFKSTLSTPHSKKKAEVANLDLLSFRLDDKCDAGVKVINAI